MAQTRKKQTLTRKTPAKAKTRASSLQSKKSDATARKKPVNTVVKKKATIQRKKAVVKHDRHPAPFTELQKNQLLELIGKIVRLHYTDRDGLKSLASIARILDPNNQQFALPSSKFDAIVKHGMVENPAVLHEHIYVFVHSKDKETKELFLCLSQIGHGKLIFGEAKTKLEKIYHTTFEKRHPMNVNGS